MLIEFTWQIAYANDKLIFACDLIRHGDRSPIKEIPKAPHIWKEGLGELTPEGMNHAYELGAIFHQKYISHYHLLPSQYSYKRINVYSTHTNRTIMSAKAVLLGLYPPKEKLNYINPDQIPLLLNRQDIPIHIVESGINNMLKPKDNVQIMKNNIPIHYSDKINSWRILTGLPLNDLQQLESLSDTLYIYKLKHVLFPKGMTQQDAIDIISLGQSAFISSFKNTSYFKETGKLFLSTISNIMVQASLKKTPLKYVLLSGHDVSIMSVMASLGKPMNSIPPYLSDLNFLLIKNRDGFYVKVYLNNIPVKINGCQNYTCTLKEFNQLATI